MKNILRVVFIMIRILIFALLVGSWAAAQTCSITTVASPTSAQVQTAINSATEGQTVCIPSGSSTWTSGVTLSGKGIYIQGAGAGRIIAYDNGTENFTSYAAGTNIFTIAGYSPNFSASSIANGETLRIYQDTVPSNYMQGTVTSLISGTLTMNITSGAISCSTGTYPGCHRWLISTIPSTVIINNSTSANLFEITEDTSLHTTISGIRIQAGSGTVTAFHLNINSGGQALLLHDNWITLTSTSGDGINFSMNRGVVWNTSFDSVGFGNAPLPIHVQSDTVTNSWTTTATWGTADTTETNDIYVETDDFHAFLNLFDNDNNGRSVFRYSLMDNSGFGTHGADTSNYGQRYFEAYNNTGVFNGYSDGTTFNMNWWFYVRGGTYVIHDNTLPALVSTDYGTKADVNMTTMNLQRNGGPNPCWGAGNASPSGQNYHAPRQVGFGYVTGTGTSSYTGVAPNPVYTVNGSDDSITYVGDSEPAYIWGNSRVPLGNTQLTDYGGVSCSQPDQTSDYVVSGRDYFNGSTAQPGYTPAPYPNPLEAGGQGGITLQGNLTVGGNVVVK